MATCLDVCCGGRSFWFDKYDPRAFYIDNRKLEIELCDGRRFSVSPDMVADFRSLPFADATFPLVVFDPPHLRRAGQNSWLAAKYGVLGENWRDELRQGFAECFRVLKPLETLVFKWSEVQVKASDVLKLAPEKPLVGDQRGKNAIWMVFQKPEGRE